MALLWMEEGQLNAVTGAVSLGVSDISVDDFLKGGTRKLTVTSEDVEWAKSVLKVAARADVAATQRDFQTAIQFYEEALALAPGADIYLMSIGCCYGNMGFLEKGATYLQYAQTISPASERIRNNLRALEARLRRQNPEPAIEHPPAPIHSDAEDAFAETVHVGPVGLKTVADFLKLIGMRVQFTTKQEESFEATVSDLSDAGMHILLDDVLRIEDSNLPGGKIVRVARRDLVDTGDLSQYVGKRIRLRMKPVGFVEGILHGAPKTTEHLELTMVTYYHPCESHSVLIDELTFVEVMDRREILF